MNRPNPAETKLLICVWHPFPQWRAHPILAETIRCRWPEMRVVEKSQLMSATEIDRTLQRLAHEIVEKSGEAFLSNATVGERFALRACIVNFNTTAEDVDALPELVARWGRELDG